MARISVIGTGYLGLTHAVCMAELGHQVIALDIDQNKLDKLAKGEVPFHEPELPELLLKSVNSGKLTFTSDWKQVAKEADFHFVCVGTPQQKGSDSADLSQVHSAIKSLAPHLQNSCLVIGKSTVPVGTATELNDILQNLAPAGSAARLVWNPEFLREGFAVKDTLHPDRIVLGVINKSDAHDVLELYKKPISEGTPVVVTDFSTAELVKVAANAFLATKISFINAFAMLCDEVGADVTTLADAIGYDERIGRKFLNAGIGFGGGCLPKDIRALRSRASELGYESQFEFLKIVDRINLDRRQEVINQAKDLLGDLRDKKIAVLGAAFKPNSDDIRDSPALAIANELQSLGANVVIHDPEALKNVAAAYPLLSSTAEVNEAVTDADLVLHLTEWQQYRELDPTALIKLVKIPKIIDGRNVLDLEHWNSAGWQLSYLGKPGS